MEIWGDWAGVGLLAEGGEGQEGQGVNFSFSFPVSLPACCVAHNLPTEMKMWKTIKNHHPKLGVGEGLCGGVWDLCPYPFSTHFLVIIKVAGAESWEQCVLHPCPPPLLTTLSLDPVTTFIFRGSRQPCHIYSQSWGLQVPWLPPTSLPQATAPNQIV